MTSTSRRHHGIYLAAHNSTDCRAPTVVVNILIVAILALSAMDCQPSLQITGGQLLKITKESLQRCLHDSPASAEARVLTLHLCEQISESETLKLRRANNILAKIHYRIADICFEKMDFKSFVVAIRTALELLPHSPALRPKDSASKLSIAGNYLRNHAQYDLAVFAHRQAILAARLHFDENDERIALYMYELAEDYLAQGRWAEAETLLWEALPIERRARHPNAAAILAMLAQSQIEQGQPAASMLLLEYALRYHIKALGDSNVEAALILDKFGMLWAYLDQPELADRMLEREHIMLLNSKAGGEVITQALLNRASLAVSQKLYQRALGLYQQAFSYATATLPAEHAIIAKISRQIGYALIQTESFGEGSQYLTRALRQEERLLCSSRTESSAQNLLSAGREAEAMLYSLALAHPAQTKVVTAALGQVFLRKGRSQEVGAIMSQDLWGALASAELRERFYRLRKLLDQQEKIWQLPDTESRRQAIIEITRKADEAEQDLSWAIGSKVSKRCLKPETVIAEIADNLPGEAVLVEIIANVSPLSTFGKTGHHNGELHYAAFLLFPDQRISVKDLGLMRDVDIAILRFRESITKKRIDVNVAGLALYQIIKDLLPKGQNGTPRVIISSDGLFNLIPFSALHDGNHYLLDTHSIRYVNSGRDLLPNKTPYAANHVLVLADPEVTTSAFPRLRAARGEATQIASMLGARAVMDTWASEGLVRNYYAPLILHMAVHGEYQRRSEDYSGAASDAGLASTQLDHQRKDTRILPAMTLQRQGSQATFPPGPLPSWDVLSILNRSALKAVSTATPGRATITDQHEWEPHEAMHASALVLSPGPSVEYDGWLTASEVRSMNLHGTQLVSLSACESGLGAVRSGQGVYGMRRAFQVAGAQTVVSSLWPVLDDVTSEMMIMYYHLLVRENAGRSDAMDTVMKRTRQNYPHPYYWAPFLVIGQSGPLSLGAN